MYENIYNNYYYFVLLNKGKNVINDYVIYSDRLIGKRFEKRNIKTISFVYYINVSSNTFSGYALINNQETIEIIDEFPNVYLVSKV